MSNQKKRNFQIDAFKHRVVVDPKYADKTWKILEHAIHEIYNHNASGLSFEELYRSLSFPFRFLLFYNLWWIYDHGFFLVIALKLSCWFALVGKGARG